MREKAYPNLENLIKIRGIKRKVIAKRLNITEKSFINKMSGITAFTWDEVCTIQKIFFPDVDKDFMMEKEE